MSGRPTYEELEKRVKELEKYESEWNQADQTYRESGEKYKSFSDATFEAIFVSEQGLCIGQNKNAERMFGYTFKEALSRMATDWIHPEYHSIVKQHILSGDENPYEAVAIRKNGSTFPCEIQALMTVQKGKPIRVTALRDIIERKNAEKVIAKKERFLNSLINAIPIPVFYKDREGIYQGFNDAFEAFMGISREQLIGKSVFDISPKEFAPTHYAKDTELFDSGGIQHYESRVKNAKDEMRDVVVDKSVYTDSNGKIIGLIGTILDITTRKKAEKEKEHLEKRLVRMEKMEALGLLAGGVAHDLNNVLSGIVSYPELLMMGLPNDHRFRKPLDLIYSSGLKASAIVNDLLTLARRGVMATEIVNLNNIIMDYLKSPEHYKLLSDYNNVVIETNLNQNLTNIKGSEIHLRTTIMNLVLNAAEAQASGGKVIISTENQNIDKPIEGYESIKEGEFAVVIIEDKGIGINAKDLQKIFEPFYTKKIMGRSGTGLGMAVVWGTVQDHYGYINIESIENKGTKFYLYFPIVRQQIEKGHEPLFIEQYLGNGEIILIVDDVEEQRQIAKSILKHLNYKVETVSSGEESVEYLKNNSCDLVLLDMIMDPGIDGLETYKQIISLKPDQKVIIVSGFSESERVKEAQKLGAGQYIKKPYSVEKIGITIKEELK